MTSQHRVEWLSYNEPPRNPPDPAFPNGIIIDAAKTARAMQSCTVDLPYPAECRGVWRVECQKCGIAFGATAAGRSDDPRQLILPCYFKAFDTPVERRGFQMRDGLVRHPFREES